MTVELMEQDKGVVHGRIGGIVHSFIHSFCKKQLTERNCRIKLESCVKDMKSLAISQQDAQSRSKWPPCLFSVRPHRWRPKARNDDTTATYGCDWFVSHSPPLSDLSTVQSRLSSVQHLLGRPLDRPWSRSRVLLFGCSCKASTTRINH